MRAGVAMAWLVLVVRCVGAEDGKLYPLINDVILDGMIVAVDAPPPWEAEETVDIVWDSAQGERRLFSDFARAGRHAYDPRRSPAWRGRAMTVATNVQGPGEFRFPTLGDELDVFLAPERLQPALVNALRGHRFFNFASELLLTLLALLATAVFFAVRRRQLGLALVAGFVLAWAVMDVRTMLDHFECVRIVEANGGTVPLISGAKRFADTSAAYMKGSSWALDPSCAEHPLAAHYFGYAFGESPRVDLANAEFVIAIAPHAGKGVHRDGPYALLHRGAP